MQALIEQDVQIDIAHWPFQVLLDLCLAIACSTAINMVLCLPQVERYDAESCPDRAVLGQLSFSINRARCH